MDKSNLTCLPKKALGHPRQIRSQNTTTISNPPQIRAAIHPQSTLNIPNKRTEQSKTTKLLKPIHPQKSRKILKVVPKAPSRHDQEICRGTRGTYQPSMSPSCLTWEPNCEIYLVSFKKSGRWRKFLKKEAKEIKNSSAKPNQTKKKQISQSKFPNLGPPRIPAHPPSQRENPHQGRSDQIRSPEKRIILRDFRGEGRGKAQMRTRRAWDLSQQLQKTKHKVTQVTNGPKRRKEGRRER